jgi:hypothetical protein
MRTVSALDPTPEAVATIQPEVKTVSWTIRPIAIRVMVLAFRASISSKPDDFNQGKYDAEND